MSEKKKKCPNIKLDENLDKILSATLKEDIYPLILDFANESIEEKDVLKEMIRSISETFHLENPMVLIFNVKDKKFSEKPESLELTENQEKNFNPQKKKEILLHDDVKNDEVLSKLRSTHCILLKKAIEDNVIIISFIDTCNLFDKERTESLKEHLHSTSEFLKNLRNLIQDMYKDPLTETFNRKALEKNLKDLKDKVIIFIDVDDFKKINDTYGHMVGDRILKELAKIIKESLRSSDTVYRYGGDEFVVVIDNSSYETAEKIAERIKKNVEDKITIESNPISISYGISTSPCDVESILKEADERMYRMKRRKKGKEK